MTAIETRTWTASNGTVRRYVQNLAELIGLDVDRYGTGNIRSASLNGQDVSNAEAGRILSTSVWIDDQGAVHVDRHTARVISADAIRAAVEAAL